ncbi:hypothetical protein NLG97_g7202 [Lecanicillium saksenae]|uniref:Uncharacterized protein n=1 Tax=Lecanicillium saksenae TaxID=468837 RepID=A0ACC1QML1_9HYPO|nr:hypothetical protein NLG97_g7202 [Lecanicillium saksenae]
MKFTLVAALFAHAALASQMATQMDAVSHMQGLQHMMWSECTEVEAHCMSTIDALLDKAVTSLKASDDAMMDKAHDDYVNALSASPDCMHQLSSCSQKIGQAFTMEYGPEHDM